MKKKILAILAGVLLLSPCNMSEAAVSQREQNLGRANIIRPVVEGVREEANQAIEQDIDRLVCKLTEAVEKSKDSEGHFTYQVISETDFYVSLLLDTRLSDKKGKVEQQVAGVLYEKLHGRRVGLEELLGFKPDLAQLEALRNQNGLETADGTKLSAQETVKIKRVPEDIAIAEDGKLYLIFQPGEMKADYQDITRLLVAAP